MLNEKDCVVQGVDYEEKPRKKSVLRNGSTNGAAKKIMLPLKKSEKNTAYSSNEDVETDLFEDDEVENEKDSQMNEYRKETDSSQNDFEDDEEDDFLTKPLQVYNGLDNGIFIAQIKRMSKTSNDKLMIVYAVFIKESRYTLYSYTDSLVILGNPLHRLIKAVDTHVSCLQDLIGKKVFISVQVAFKNNRRYENVVDFASAEFLRSELRVDNYGRFIR